MPYQNKHTKTNNKAKDAMDAIHYQFLVKQVNTHMNEHYHAHTHATCLQTRLAHSPSYFNTGEKGTGNYSDDNNNLS